MKLWNMGWMIIVVEILIGSACDDTMRPGVDSLPRFWCTNTLDGTESLCEWQVEQGAVAPAASWDETDTHTRGVELFEEARISKRVSAWPVPVSDPIRFLATPCFKFTWRASSEDPEAMISLDFSDDGSPEWQNTLDTQQVPRQVQLDGPVWFEHVRLRVTRNADTNAKVVLWLASLEADYCSDTHIPIEPTPGSIGLGGQCEADTQCKSNTCVSQVPANACTGNACATAATYCSECRADRDCAEGKVCGVSPESQAYAYRACVPASDKATGESCAVNDECKTGRCCQGICSECCDNADCAVGGSCTKHDINSSGVGLSFRSEAGLCTTQGAPARHTGQACLVDDDCASKRCTSSSNLGLCTLTYTNCNLDPGNAPSCAPWASTCRPTNIVRSGVCE